MKLKVRGKSYKIVKCPSMFRGMMFRTFKSFDGMLFKFPWKDIWGIWTPFCVRMDLVFISDDAVVDIKKAKPWRIYYPNRPANRLIEMKLGSNVKIGDKITLK